MDVCEIEEGGSSGKNKLAAILETTNMKQPILYCLICLTLSAYAQTTEPFPNEIKSKKTNKHVNIVGTGIFVIPPKGFTVMPIQTFRPEVMMGGFGKTEKENLTFNVMRGVTNYYRNTDRILNVEEIESNGQKVLDHKEILVDGYSAKYAFTQDSTSKYLFIVFGDSTFVAAISAIYQANDEQTGEELRKSMLSVYYDKDKIFDPLEVARFKFDDTKSKFKFSHCSKLGTFDIVYNYSLNGIRKEDHEFSDEPQVIVMTVPRNTSVDINAQIKAMESYSLLALWYGGITTSKIDTSDEKVNGYNASITEIKAGSDSEPVEIYLLVVANANNVVSVLYTAVNNFEENMNEFKKLARTITVK